MEIHLPVCYAWAARSHHYPHVPVSPHVYVMEPGKGIKLFINFIKVLNYTSFPYEKEVQEFIEASANIHANTVYKAKTMFTILTGLKADI